MTEGAATVIVVDDDAAMRDALHGLLRSVGLEVVLFSRVSDLLAARLPDGPCCLILDVRMPGESGLDLQAALVKANNRVPIIFISGYGDVQMSVRAMKAGAVEFLVKPFRHQDLLDAVRIALERDAARRREEQEVDELRRRQDALTAREKEVMGMVAEGRLNKQIARALGVSEVTVKVHRGQVMRKMGARSVAELVRMADKLGMAARPE